MTTKEYLGRAYQTDCQISRMLNKVSALREALEASTARLTNMPKSPSPSNTKMADVVAEITDLERIIDDKADLLAKQRAEIIDAIYGVDNEAYREILEDRYIRFLTWPQIAKKTGYTDRHVRRLHDIAIREVRIPRS